MGLKLPNAVTIANLTDPRWWAKTLNLATTTVSAGTITDESFADRGGNTLFGRAAGTAGKPSDIGVAPGQFVANRSGTIVGTVIADSDIPSSITRDTELSDAIATHDALATSHALLAYQAQFILATELFT